MLEWGGVGENETQFISNEYTWILQTRNFQEFQIDNLHRFFENENCVGFFLTEVQLTYSIMLVSGAQHRIVLTFNSLSQRFCFAFVKVFYWLY